MPGGRVPELPALVARAVETRHPRHDVPCRLCRYPGPRSPSASVVHSSTRHIWWRWWESNPRPTRIPLAGITAIHLHRKKHWSGGLTLRLRNLSESPPATWAPMPPSIQTNLNHFHRGRRLGVIRTEPSWLPVAAPACETSPGRDPDTATDRRAKNASFYVALTGFESLPDQDSNLDLHHQW